MCQHQNRTPLLLKFSPGKVRFNTTKAHAVYVYRLHCWRSIFFFILTPLKWIIHSAQTQNRISLLLKFSSGKVRMNTAKANLFLKSTMAICVADAYFNGHYELEVYSLISYKFQFKTTTSENK